MTRATPPTFIQLSLLGLAFAACGRTADRQHPSATSRERELQLITQQGSTDCGDAALAMTLAYYGRPATLAAVTHDMPPTDQGVNALDIVELARARGLGASGVHIDGPDAAKDYLERGDILHVDGAHWVVVDRVDDQSVRVVDPAHGVRLIDTDPDHHEFDGFALLFADNPNAMAARMRRYQK